MLSITVPTFNRVDVLEELIVSLKAQSFVDFECFIADNGPSDDGTKELMEKTCKEDDRFIHLTMPAIGYTAAINEGLKDARGEIFVVMDDDIELVDEHTLQVIVDKFKVDDELGAVQMSEYYPDGKGKPESIVENFGSRSVKKLWENSANYPPGMVNRWGMIGTKLHNLPWGKDHSVNHLRSSCIAIRADLFRAVGGFCVDYVIFGRGYRGDTDVSVGIHKLGYKVVYSCSSIQVYHKLAPKPRGWERKKIESRNYLIATHRNNMYFVLRNFWGYWTSPVYFIWDLLVGSTQQSGILRQLRWGPRSLPVLKYSLQGKLMGYWLFLKRGKRKIDSSHLK